MPLGASVNEHSRPVQCADCGEFQLWIREMVPGTNDAVWRCSSPGCEYTETVTLPGKPIKRFNATARVRELRAEVARLKTELAKRPIGPKLDESPTTERNDN